MSDPVASFLEELVGGFRGGHEFRTGIADRKRRIATEQENQDYQRVRRLREAVATELQRRVGEGELTAQGRTAQHQTETREQERDRRARVAAAAAQIRQQYGTNPRYKGITLLPDEDLVREFGDLITNPQRFERPAGDSPGRAVTRQDLGSVERQLDDTDRTLARAEREMPTPGIMQRGSGARPGEPDYDRFTADSTTAAGRVNTLRQRADSLGVVRDSLAASVQGRRYVRPGAKRRITADQAEYLKAIGQWDPNRYEVGP